MKKRKPVSPIDNFVIQRIKEIRLEQGYTQATLAYELDVSEGFIGQIESDNSDSHYNIRHLNELVRIFKCKFADFFPDGHI